MRALPEPVSPTVTQYVVLGDRLKPVEAANRVLEPVEVMLMVPRSSSSEPGVPPSSSRIFTWVNPEEMLEWMSSVT